MRTIACLFVSLIALGCSDKVDRPNKVVLVFQDWGKEDPFFEERSKVKYVDDFLIPHVFTPGEFGRYKRVIATSRDYIDIAYRSHESMTRHFLLRNGDSVLISSQNDWPVFTVLNREVDHDEINFESRLQRDLYNGSSTALEQYHYYWTTANDEISPISGDVIAEELQLLKERGFVELTRESSYIDSLFRNGLVSHETAEFYQRKNAYQRNQLRLFDNDSVRLHDEGLVEPILSGINGCSEDPIAFVSTFHDDFITAYYFGFLFRDVQAETDPGSLGRLVSYPAVFGKSLIFKHIDKLLPAFTVERGKMLLDSLDDDSLFNHWSNYWYSKYNMDQQFGIEWTISNYQQGTLTFDELLHQNRGNILYVDLWASWCLKSIQEVPSLARLYRDYQIKGVNVVHISVDREVDKWRWAEGEYLAFNRSNSYKIQEEYLGTLSDAFAMNAIPRYLLFDTQGNLIHNNAPGPTSEEIRMLLDRYLPE